jgi:Putative beta-barrel porin-2, OmpL-like. bbp2
MKHKLAGIVLGFGLIFLAVGVGSGAEEEKPLAPGWLSLDGIVGPLDKGIADGKGALEKALGITMGGYLDTSYTWSSNHPRNPSNISGRYFDKDHNKITFNDFHVFVEKPEKDWGVGFRISGDFGRTGELLREATLWGKSLHREPSAELREAYLTTTIPLGEGIAVKAGKFVTTQGTEIILAPGAYNDNISRSYAFNFAIPFTHLGTLFSYPFHKTLTGSMGLITGWDNPRDNNGAPSGMAGVNFSPTNSFALASNVILGPEQTHNTNHQRLTWSNVATIKPIDPLTLLLEYTLGFEDKAPTPSASAEDAWWHAFAGIASYNWTERFNTALRAELFYDAQAARTGGFAATKTIHNVALGEFTLTGTYKFTKMFLGRAEFRQDFANRPVFKKGSSGADSNQTTMAVQLLYQY